MKISDISAEISLIYRILVPIDTISAFNNCLKEKSPKNWENRRYIANISVTNRYFGTEGHAPVGFFLFQFIVDIFDISAIYRSAVCGVEIHPAKDPTVHISPDFQRLV